MSQVELIPVHTFEWRCPHCHEERLIYWRATASEGAAPNRVYCDDCQIGFDAVRVVVPVAPLN